MAAGPWSGCRSPCLVPGAGLGDHAFDVPALPSDVPALPSDAEPPIDARAALERLVEGELVELAPLLHPGLRLIATS